MSQKKLWNANHWWEFTSLSSLGNQAQKSGQEDHKRLWRTRIVSSRPDRTPTPWTHSSCGGMHRSCRRSGQSRLWKGKEGRVSPPSLRGHWELMASWGRRDRVYKGCGPWLYFHGWSTPRCVEPTHIRSRELFFKNKIKKRVHKAEWSGDWGLGLRGNGEWGMDMII